MQLGVTVAAISMLQPGPPRYARRFLPLVLDLSYCSVTQRSECLTFIFSEPYSLLRLLDENLANKRLTYSHAAESHIQYTSPYHEFTNSTYSLRGYRAPILGAAVFSNITLLFPTMPSLSSLPLEMLGEIGGHLQMQDLHNCSLACKVLDAGIQRHLFRKMAFAGTRAVMAEVLLRFLSNKNQSRTRAMSSVCSSLRIEVLPQDDDPFDEGKDLLPALLISTKKNLPGVTCLSLSLHGLSSSEIASLHRMLKEGPRYSLRNVESMDVVPSMARHGVASIKEGCPDLRRLRVNFKNPLYDFHQHLRGGSWAKLNQLENMEQLVVQEKGPATTYPIGGISRPIDITTRLCTVADQLRDSPTLRQLSIEFHPRIMTWIMLPAQRLNPGQRHRTELDTFVMTGIMAMGARLPQVEEICLVERSAVFNGVNMIHRGVRDPDGEMAVTIEAPGHENTFPLNISH
ncbi:hypothetical protein IWW34DRAFT_781234 [Fusarium oxysporum f. sp. albedinis]|nr:hypothetical protein IWW34DRAFT_781234 [Fusarium oxysporum f. sp. albedinis]